MLCGVSKIVILGTKPRLGRFSHCFHLTTTSRYKVKLWMLYVWRCQVVAVQKLVNRVSLYCCCFNKYFWRFLVEVPSLTIVTQISYGTQEHKASYHSCSRLNRYRNVPNTDCLIYKIAVCMGYLRYWKVFDIATRKVVSLSMCDGVCEASQ